MSHYGLIIVDDEQMMRDGLSSYVKWEDIGFRLDGVFNDGKDAMEWLGENDTHVILTDLRMTHTSGLDVASFVREKGLDVKVVIISGYSDFEAAQKAIGYNVRDYLLKPLSVKKIRETLGRLKDELDSEKENRISIDRRIEQFESLQNYVEERFISQLLLGGLRRPDELERQIDMIRWDRSMLSQPCVIVSLSVAQGDGTETLGDYDSDDRSRLLGGMISGTSSPPRFFWYRTSTRYLDGIFVGCGKLEGLEERITGRLNRAIEQAKAFSIHAAIRRIQVYKDLDSFARNTETLLSETGVSSADMNLEWEEGRRLIISHVLANQAELAVEMLDSYMESLNGKSWDTLVNGLVDLFSSINQTFNKTKIGVQDTGLISFADFFSLEDRDAVYTWARNAIAEVTERVKEDASLNRISLINRAKEFVENNFVRDIALSEVAEQVNLSPVYLSRFFKEHAGINFSEYLIECRVRRACQLLRETGLKVYEICREVGYSDVKHFYGLFRRHVGCSPSEYRHGR